MSPLDETISLAPRYSAFADYERRLYVGSDVLEAARAAAAALSDGSAETAVVFDDLTGALTDVDPRAAAEEVRDRLVGPVAEAPREGPGRPKLGVVSREVSLLPRHWAWLAAQRGGASATIRRLVEAASKEGAGEERARRALEAVGKFLSVVGGDRHGYEATSRALYAGDWARAAEIPAESGWPADLAMHVAELVERAERAHEARG